MKELDETNRLLEYWVEFSPAVLYSLTLDAGKARPSYVSKNFSRLTGHERTAFVIDPDFWGEHVHAGDRPAYLAALSHMIDGDVQEQSIRYRIAHASGAQRPIIDAMRVIQNSHGAPLEIVGAWLDLSDGNH